MIDKRLEKKIKRTKEFMELWVKFHDMYKHAIADAVVTPEDEKGFLETKSLLARKYQALRNLLEMEPSYDDRTFDVITQILSLNSVSDLSDLSIKKIENDWHNSYILLNKLLGDLEGKKEEMAGISNTAIFLRKIFLNPIVNLLILTAAIIMVYFLTMHFLKAAGIYDTEKEKIESKIEFKEEVEKEVR